MKYVFYLAFLLAIVTSCQEEKKCSNFKTGVFKFANPNFSEWTVYRTDSTQVEISSITNTEVNNSIKWVSDCEYHLTATSIINDKLNYEEIDYLKVEIYKTSTDRYFCYSKSNLSNLNLEMIKISEID